MLRRGCLVILFAVFHGEYDQFNLYGVFSSREQATEFLADLNSRVIQGACKGKEPYSLTEGGLGEIREIFLDVGCIPEHWVFPAKWRAAGPCRVCESAGLPDCNAHPVSV